MTVCKWNLVRDSVFKKVGLLNTFCIKYSFDAGFILGVDSCYYTDFFFFFSRDRGEGCGDVSVLYSNRLWKRIIRYEIKKLKFRVNDFIYLFSVYLGSFCYTLGNVLDFGDIGYRFWFYGAYIFAIEVDNI